jgi:hypothetical protein
MSNVTVVPWGLHPLERWVVDELEDRAKQYGQNPDNELYSGPRTAWVRFFSNGKSTLPGARELDGFALLNTEGFNESYGFNPNKEIVIGVDAKGQNHTINAATYVAAQFRTGGEVSGSDFPHRPPPGVESVTCELSGTSNSFPNLCRKITVNWKCNSLAQLNYLIPYFLTPRITCLVEWGWNNYDRVSLIDLSDTEYINKVFTDPALALRYLKDSGGNYDVGMGFICDYGFRLNDNGGYDCYTTIINANSIIGGEQIKEKETTIKEGNNYLSAKSFYEFSETDLKNIDADTDEMKQMRKKLRIGKKGTGDSITDNIKERVFRMKDPEGKQGLWLRMDLIQDIINAFFKLKMSKGSQTVTVIREFDINDTKICASPLLKSADPKILVPNKFAPRFTYEAGVENIANFPNIERGDRALAQRINEQNRRQVAEQRAAETYRPEQAEYNMLFKDISENIRKEYVLNTEKFDNLQEAINPYGESFPQYTDLKISDPENRVFQTLKSGTWGYLRDLFVSEEYFRTTVQRNDSVLELIKELLQGINTSLCQICQLKLIPAEYGNRKYSVYDENLPGTNDTQLLPKISLGSIGSSYIQSANMDVKLSAEMMNQLVMQSANPQADPNGSTKTQTVPNPIVSRYSAGDRLYDKGDLNTVVSDKSPSVAAPTGSNAQTSAEEASEKASIERKQQLRNDQNNKTFLIYRSRNEKKYILAERDSSFLNYILKLQKANPLYLNNAIMPGTTLQLTFSGISGINYLSQFLLDHAPEAYNYRNAVWQIMDIKQQIENKNWTTTIVANVRPLTVL